MQEDPRAEHGALSPFRYLQWGPIIAGALAAAALSLVLHAFAAAIGLGVSSTAPTWRDASLALWILSGTYLVVVAAAAYSLGGYVAGRMRLGLRDASHDEAEFRDGVHGLLVWALATLLTALLAITAAQGLARLAAPASSPLGTSAAPGEGLFVYEIDKLFRSDIPVADIAYSREQASRILLTTGSGDGVTTEDRAQLARLVASRTAISEAEAQQRVESAIIRADESLTRARRSTVLLAFFAGAAAMIGAAAAWFAACAGGEHRDSTKLPSLLGARRRAQYVAS